MREGSGCRVWGMGFRVWDVLGTLKPKFPKPENLQSRVP